MDIAFRLYLLFVICYFSSWYYCRCQEYIVLNGPFTWDEASERCDLANDTQDISGVVPPGVSVWIGKRRDFTRWLAVEDCGVYTLSPSLSTVITIKGQYPILECQTGCSKLYNKENIRFGLELDGSPQCVCDNPNTTPDFGTRTSKCNVLPVNCSRNTDLPDLCGAGEGRLVVYSDRPDAQFQGGGECGTFKRNTVSLFSAIAQPCNEKHGYLQLISQVQMTDETLSVEILPLRSNLIKGIYRAIIPTNGVIWKEAAREADVRQELKRFSSRDTVDETWRGLSSQEWPLNISLWVGVLRASKSRQNSDDSPCVTGLCYCVAVYLHNDGTIEEKLLNCTMKQPALCVSGSIKTTTVQINTTASSMASRGTTAISTHTTSIHGSTELSTHQTTSPGDMVKKQTFHPLIGVFIAGVTIVFVAALSCLFVIFRRRKLKGKMKIADSNENVTTVRRPTEHSYVSPLVLNDDHNYQALNNYDSIRQSVSPSVRSDTSHTYVEVIDDECNVPQEMIYGNSHTKIKVLC